MMRGQQKSPSLFVSTSAEDLLLKKVLQTHSPDGRHVDAEPLLYAVENIMQHVTNSNPKDPDHALRETVSLENTRKTEVVAGQESVGRTINELLHQIMCKRFDGGYLHATTMMVLDLLGRYSWDGKLVLVLAAFAMGYGELFLITKFYPVNLLAASIAILTQLPNNKERVETDLKRRLKALNSLTKAMVDVTKCIIQFEGLPMQYKTLDMEAMAATKACIHLATYCVVNCAVASASQIADLKAMTREKVSPTTMTWELWSLVYKVKNTLSHLRKQLDGYYRNVEAKLQQLLVHHFEEKWDDNQKVLGALLSMKDEFPLMNGYSKEEFGIDILRSKIVLFIFSRVDISLTQMLLLMQQTYGYPNCKVKESYEIVWVPFPNSISWNHVEKRAFTLLANTFPWYSISRPWLLSSTALNYFKEVWNFKGDPLMVVLDEKGRVICENAINMVLIWGDMAYPFSTSREEQLWEEARWTLDFIMGEIDPLTSMWIEEGRTVFVYGSDNIGWIREFCNKMKDMIKAGVSLELLYVGNNNSKDHIREILTTMTKEKLSGYLSETKIEFFWIRLNSMRTSKIHLGKDIQADGIMKQVTSLLSYDSKQEGWVVAGQGSSTNVIQLDGRILMDCLAFSQIWIDNIEKVGLLNAIRNALDPFPPIDQHCDHSSIVPYVEGSKEEIIFCQQCKRPVKKFILYQCHVIND